MRHVILHYHIFKNAGSTIDSILKNNFGPEWASIDGNNPSETLDSKIIAQYLMDNPGLKALSSHQARFPLPDSPGMKIHPIVFLRHPIDRIGSVYRFERHQPLSYNLLNIKIARENDINEYVKWRLADNNGAVIKNFQTVYLSGREKHMKTALATTVDLENAKSRIRSLDFFGIVEFFSDSILGLKKHLSNDFADININYNIQNKTSDEYSTLENRLQGIRESLKPALYDEMIEKNSLDLELYSYALDLFNAGKT
jgi:hypothetical protein